MRGIRLAAARRVVWGLVLVCSVGLAGCETTSPAPPAGAVGDRLLASRSGALTVMEPYDLQFWLEGEGAESGVPLSARVDVEIESEAAFIFAVTNTSPPESSSEEHGPVLTRVGFQLVGSPAIECLAFEEDDPGRFDLVSQPGPFCGLGGVDAEPFTYGLVANDPAAGNGIARGETLLFRIARTPECEAAVAFTRDTLLSAEPAASDGQAVRWAAKFQVVGAGGEDSGCAQDTGPRDGDYTFSEFVAVAAEVEGSPSISLEDDTRAGSVELNFNGGHGFDGIFTDAPFNAGILNLRNGAGEVLEQWQIGRRWEPADLPESRCTTALGFLQCWLARLPGVDVEAAVPSDGVDSNTNFDTGGERVTIASVVELEAGEGTGRVDNSGQRFRVTWTAPRGIDTARLNLRLHFDADLDGDMGNDPFVPLYRIRWPGDGPDLITPVVTVVEQTDTVVTIEVDVQEAMEFVWLAYSAMGWPETTAYDPGGDAISTGDPAL